MSFSYSGLDIVYPDSKRCCCFTKSYYRYVKGTGSLLATVQVSLLFFIQLEKNSYTPQTLNIYLLVLLPVVLSSENMRIAILTFHYCNKIFLYAAGEEG